MLENKTNLFPSGMLLRVVAMIIVSIGGSGLAHRSGIASTQPQILAVGVFLAIICATLLFWDFRLAIAFIGIAVLLSSGIMTLDQMLESTELDIILFLAGMMILVGVLKDMGLFSWLIQSVINLRRMNGPTFTIILVILSGVMAGLVDEVTSIVFMLALIFQVCDTLKLRPTPFVLMSVMATNIGSSGTMLGNPVGIMIGTKSGFSFNDFIVWAAPVAFLCLLLTLGLLFLWFRKDIALMSARLEERRGANLPLGPLVHLPYKRGLTILLGTIALIALHHKIETVLGMAPNTFLIITPLTISGILMIYRRRRAHHYVENDVDWWSLLFFMMLFAIASSLESTGVTHAMAYKFKTLSDGNLNLMIPMVIVLSSLGSAFVDNIVFVAAFIPVIQTLHSTPLWWALLFGACLGGNITVIGSTANIVAVGLFEKRYREHISFLRWLKIGIIVGTLTCVTAWLAILLLHPYMPPMPQQ